MLMLTNEPTPCEVLFDTLKRKGGISHRELADIILSNRPLADGRSPQSRAKDRTWLSHVIVHAPVGTHSERYFGDFGMSASRVASRMRARRGGGMTNAQIADLLLGGSLERMERALTLCHQNAYLYRNALLRLLGLNDPADVAQLSEDVVIEPAILLFLATGGTSDVVRSVNLAMEYASDRADVAVDTPSIRDIAERAGDGTDPADAAGVAGMPAGSIPTGMGAAARDAFTLGLLRVSGDFVAGDIHWLSPAFALGADITPSSAAAADESCYCVTIGSLAGGPNDVTDVGPSVSSEHARVCVGNGKATIEDLGSSNGTTVVDGLTQEVTQLKAGESAQIKGGDRVKLGCDTEYLVVIGQRGL